MSADLRGALSPVVESHHASITHPKAIEALLRSIEGYEGSLVIKCALRLAALVFVRPGELRKAEWAEVAEKYGAVYKSTTGSNVSVRLGEPAGC